VNGDEAIIDCRLALLACSAARFDLFNAGAGPIIAQLSPRRIGVTVASLGASGPFECLVGWSGRLWKVSDEKVTTMSRIADSKRRSKRKPFSFPTCRLREIERTIPTRDLDQIRAVLPEVASTYRAIFSFRCQIVGEGELQERLEQWCIRMGISRAFTADEIAEAIEQAERRKSLATADRLAEILGLEYADRKRLAICTIGAIDMDKRRRTIERKERKREKDRIRDAIKRRNRGATSREEYLAESLTRARPWEREGISRRTWERHRDASCSPPLMSLPSEGLATKGNVQPAPPAIGDAVIALAGEIGAIEQARPVGGKIRAA